MRYLIGDLVGRGSFGRVHEAYDRAGSRYAVKIVDADDEAGLGLLRAQYRILAAADHHRVARVYDLVEDDDAGCYIVMEYVDGRSLVDHVREHGTGCLPGLAARVLDALRHLHSLGAAHGDLKPDSILVCRTGDAYDVKLVDVGFDAQVGEKLPTIKGTLPYLAPEAIRSAACDARSDLYSLGAVLFEALTGASPFSGLSPEEILNKHLEFTPPPPSVVSGESDPRWDGFVSMLLSKEPSRRYAGALQAAIALGKAFGDTDAVIASLSPPRSLVHLWSADAERVECVLDGRRGEAAVVQGPPGAGTANVLRSVGARLKSRGSMVIAASLEDDAPLSWQVIQALGGGPARPGAGETPAQPSEERLLSLDSILQAYDVDAGRGRRLAVLIDGGSRIQEADLRAMAELAAAWRGWLDVVVGVESDGDAGTRLTGRAGLEVIPLAALMSEGIGETVRRHFGVMTVPTDLLEALVGNTRNDADLLQETLVDLWNRGDIKYRLRGDVLEIEWMKRTALPETFRQVLEERIADLGPAALHAAAMIALAGGGLERKVILETMDSPGAADAIGDLLRREVILDAGEAGMLRFRHSEIRSLVRDRVPPDWRAATALKLAGAVEALGGGPDASYRIGLLYLEAGAADRALPHLRTAGEYFARFSVSDALLAYGRALDSGPPPAERADIEERMGDLRVIESDFDAARDLFDRASEVRPSAARKLGWARALKGNYEEAEAILTKCGGAAAEAGDKTEQALVGLDLAFVYAVRGKIDESLKVIREARAFFDGEKMPFQAGMAAYREAISLMRAGSHGKAISAWEEAIPLFEKSGDRRLVAQSLQAIGLACRKTLDYARAEESLKQSLEIWSDLKGLSKKAAAHNNYAFVLLEKGDIRGAMESAVEALELNTLAGNANGASLARMLMAAIELDVGNWKNAERLLGEARTAIPPEDLYLKAQVQRYSAAARSLAGDAVAALALARESYSSARLAGDEEGKYQALLEKAAALLRSGAPAEAADAARDALVGFTQETSLLFAALAQTLLGEALCAEGNLDEGFEKLEAARENLQPVSRSQYTARALTGLARASYLRRDHATFAKHMEAALGILRGGEARYDYAVAIHLAGMEAMQRGAFVRARHNLTEAARIFDSLEIEDLHGKVVKAMEAIPGGEVETKAVNSLSRISEALISSRDIDRVLNVAMDMAMDYLGADRGVLMLAAEKTGELVTVVERKMDDESLREVADISKSIVQSVRSTGEAVIATDLEGDPRFRESKSIRAHNIMSVMCLPLMRGENLLGLIYLDTRGLPVTFTNLERAFVDAFANQVALAVENARVMGSLRSDCEDLKERVGERYTYANILGPGPAMQEVFRQVERAARTDTSILLTGESGTGKDVVATLIHELSPRRDGPFIKVNCPTIAKDLVESELFGIEKSVATGVAPRSGFFERADGGTIFLNEIGDVPLATQVRVLQAIEDKEFERVGGSRVIKVDVRVISATNQDLKKLMEAGSFRKDLYFRLNHIWINLPPLRERMDDLPDLIDYFVRKYAAKNSKPVRRVSREAMEALLRYQWPGNVRELERCIEHGVVFTDGEEIGLENLSAGITEPLLPGTLIEPLSRFEGTLPQMVAEFEKLRITEALVKYGWNKSRAARRLGLHEATIRKKMKQYGIEKPRT